MLAIVRTVGWAIVAAAGLALAWALIFPAT